MNYHQQKAVQLFYTVISRHLNSSAVFLTKYFTTTWRQPGITTANTGRQTVSSRVLHERKLFKSPLLRLVHTSLRAVCMRRNYLSRRSRGLRITEAYTAGLLTDYMCLIQDAFPGIFFELRFSLCFFILQRKLYFFLTRKTVFSKKNSPKLYFF